MPCHSPSVPSEGWTEASESIPDSQAKGPDGIHLLLVSESFLSRHAKEVLWLRASGSF